MSLPARPAALTDEELVRRAAAGDGESFAELVPRYFGLAYAVALARLRNPDAAEELAQEVFLRVHARLNTLDDPKAFPAWVIRIARNLSADWVKTGCRESALVSLVPLDESALRVADPSGISPRDKVAAGEETARVRQAIDTLPVVLREMVLLHYAEELSKSDIARRLGVHPSSVGRRLDQALAALRESLATLPARPLQTSDAPVRLAARRLRSRPAAVARSLAILGAVSALNAAARASLVSLVASTPSAPGALLVAVTYAASLVPGGKAVAGGLVTGSLIAAGAAGWHLTAGPESGSGSAGSTSVELLESTARSRRAVRTPGTSAKPVRRSAVAFLPPPPPEVAPLTPAPPAADLPAPAEAKPAETALPSNAAPASVQEVVPTPGAVAVHSFTPIPATPAPRPTYAAGGPSHEVIIESRKEGKNFDRYTEVTGSWQDSNNPPIMAKSGAAGLTPQGTIGSRKFLLKEPPTGDPNTLLAAARFSPMVPAPGHYWIYVTWPKGGNAAPVRYRIKHSGGEDSVAVTQDGFGYWGIQNANEWVLLGDFDFDPTPEQHVELQVTGETTCLNPNPRDVGQVFADGVRFSTEPLPDGMYVPGNLPEMVTAAPQGAAPVPAATTATSQTDEAAGLVWHTSIEQGLQAASRSGKNLFVFFYTTGSRLYEQTVFEAPEVKPLLRESFILVRINLIENAQLAGTMRVFRSGTINLYRPNGEGLDQISDLLSARDLAAKLRTSR